MHAFLVLLKFKVFFLISTCNLLINVYFLSDKNQIFSEQSLLIFYQFQLISFASIKRKIVVEKLSFSSSKFFCVHTTAFYREPKTGSSNIEIMSKLRHLSELTREFSREKYFQLFSLFKSSVREWKRKTFEWRKEKKWKLIALAQSTKRKNCSNYVWEKALHSPYLVMNKSRQKKISDKFLRKLKPKISIFSPWLLTKPKRSKAALQISNTDLHKWQTHALVIWAFLVFPVLELGRKLNLMSFKVPRIAIVFLWEDFFFYFY